MWQTLKSWQFARKPFTQYSSFHGFYQALPSQIAFQWGNVKKQTDQDQTNEQNDIDGISSHLCRKDINKALVVVKSANPFHSCITIYVSIHSNRWNLLVDRPIISKYVIGHNQHDTSNIIQLKPFLSKWISHLWSSGPFTLLHPSCGRRKSIKVSFETTLMCKGYVVCTLNST